MHSWSYDSTVEPFHIVFYYTNYRRWYVKINTGTICL